MVNIERDKMKKCFQLILEKKFSDARNLFKSDDYQGSDINSGIKFAIEGIIDFLNDESKEKYLKDINRLKRLRQSFKRRVLSSWSDDFDREYFGIWIGFLDFLQRQLKSNANGVVYNPSKEPKSDEAT
jgi:hypothetical protein